MNIPPELEGCLTREEVNFLMLAMICTALGITEDMIAQTVRQYICNRKEKHDE